MTRFVAELGMKVAVWLGLAAGICIPYFGIQRLRGQGWHEVPETWVDRWVAFEPVWIGVYLSVCALVPLAPAFAANRRHLGRYAKGLAAMCAVCFALFWLLPVAGPRPVEFVDHAVYRWIVGVDRPSNSMPSLHAALVVYSLLFIDRVLREDGARRMRQIVALAGWSWALLIFYSTLATKQHWALDLPAGAITAWGAHAWAWRQSRP